MIRVPNRLIRYVIILQYTLRDMLQNAIETLEELEENQPDDKESQTKQRRGAARKRGAAASR